MIRFRNLRPAIMPELFGFASENCAHRVSVIWDGPLGLETGVYVFRRDTNSRWVELAGGRIFPGVNGHASFNSDESGHSAAVRISDSELLVNVEGTIGGEFKSSVFSSLEVASDYFKADRLGLSPGRNADRLEAIELNCHVWETKNLDVSSCYVREFETLSDAIVYDHALIMHEVSHHWVERKTVRLTS